MTRTRQQTRKTKKKGGSLANHLNLAVKTLCGARVDMKAKTSPTAVAFHEPMTRREPGQKFQPIESTASDNKQIDVPETT
jgi:hypothetical protein